LSSSAGPYGSLAYEYDSVGNRTQKTLGSAVTTYTMASGNNRLASISGAETATFGYDANGNTTDDGTLTYTYDLNNRLITTTQGGTVKGEYEYDGLGRRVKKTVGSVTTYFLYDLTGSLIGEVDGSGNISTARVWLEETPAKQKKAIKRF
jgi:YD repeat-containing protein